MFKMGINKKNGLKPCFFKIKTLFRKIEKKIPKKQVLPQLKPNFEVNKKQKI